MEACNTNDDDKLVYKEVKACLQKHAKTLGLNTKEKWAAAKWGLAKAAVLDRKGLNKADKQIKKLSSKK